VRQLVANGDRVRVLDNLDSGRRERLPSGVEFLLGDVREAGDVRRAIAGVDGCFHLAAIASVERCANEWAASHATNLTGAINVFEKAPGVASAPTPVVYASSAAVFGDQAIGPLSETSPLRPISPYGADKLGCEQHASIATHLFGIPTAGLRFFNVYGPDQDPASPYAGVIAKFIDGALARRPLQIFGDGGQVRDFVFVGDAVDHLIAAMTHLTNGGPPSAVVLNVCTGTPTTIRELAGLVLELAGAESALEFRAARPGDIRFSLGDPTTAREILGRRAGTSLAEGLAATLKALKAALASA
jgi:UDP-glucose 4-epimerase